jgi:hemoglobin
MKKDISTLKDIQFLVDKFYETVRTDTFIGPIFNSRLDGRWEEHHRKLYRFWHKILLRGTDYFGDPVPVHFDMNLDDRHFERWLQLWTSTVDEYFEGKLADKAKLRGSTMAAAFLSKILKANPINE